MKTTKWYNSRRTERIKRINKERLDNIITFIVLFILLILLVVYDSKETTKAVDDCVKNGNSYNYCMEKLG